MSNVPQSVTPAPEKARLAIHRFEEGCKDQILCLDNGPVLGFMTVWEKTAGRSYYVDPSLPFRAKGELVWKGYLPALIWRPKTADYLPIVWEITESLELDLRGVVQRGQHWEVTRGVRVGKKRPPVIGRLLGMTKCALIAPAFDVMDCVRWTYHDQRCALALPCPAAARTMVSPIVMDRPTDPLKEEQPKAPPPKEVLEEFRKRTGLAYRQASGKEQLNGK